MHCCIYSWQKLLLWRGFNENWIFQLQFNKSEDSNYFPQTSFWFPMFQILFLFCYPHTFSAGCCRTGDNTFGFIWVSPSLHLSSWYNRAFLFAHKTVLVGRKELKQFICDPFLLWFLGESFCKRKEVAWLHLPVNMLLTGPPGRPVIFDRKVLIYWVFLVGYPWFGIT